MKRQDAAPVRELYEARSRTDLHTIRSVLRLHGLPAGGGFRSP